MTKWKKTNEDEWIKNSYKLSESKIFLFSPMISSRYSVEITFGDNRKETIHKFFDTRTQALLFINKYMEKH